MDSKKLADVTVGDISGGLKGIVLAGLLIGGLWYGINQMNYYSTANVLSRDVTTQCHSAEDRLNEQELSNCGSYVCQIAHTMPKKSDCDG